MRFGGAWLLASAAAGIGCGCGPRSAEPASAVTIAPAGAAAGLPGNPCSDTPASAVAKRPSESPSQCTIRAESAYLRDMLVPLRGAEPLHLTLTSASVEASLHAGTTIADVRVAGALAFEGVSDVDTFAVRRALDLPGGFVRAGTRARLSSPRVEGDSVVGDLALRDVVARSVRVLCSSLTLAAESPEDPQPVFGKDVVRPTESAEKLVLFANPDSQERLQLAGMLVFSRSAQKGDWSEVAARFDDGSRVSGWVPTNALEPVPKGEEINVSSDGLALCGFGCPGGGEQDPEQGKVTVKAGSTIHAAPGGESWAMITRDLELDASRRGGDAPWVRLTSLPGVEEDHCADVRHAYVAASATRDFHPGG